MSENRTNWLVVGVSGVTCGGKTMFANDLHAEFPEAIVLHQDNYFLPPSDPRHVVVSSLNHINWEISTSLDMDKMKSDIREILASPPPDVPLLIIEGFLIFTDNFISSVCQNKIFFTLTKEDCWARRSVRTYDPPDVPGYFEQVIWPEYERHLQLALTINSDLTLIHGTRDHPSLVEDYKTILSSKICAKL